jgi:hypothetical protein
MFTFGQPVHLSNNERAARAARHETLTNQMNRMRTAALTSYLRGINLNNIHANVERHRLLYLKLRNLRSNPNATPANYKKIYNNMTPLKNTLRRKITQAHNTLNTRLRHETRPNQYLPPGPNTPPFTHNPRWHAYQEASRHLRSLRTLKNGVNWRVKNIPTAAQVSILQRLARGLITRKRLNNPFWGRSYANVAAGRPGIGYKSVQRRLSKLN